jgi:integrase
MDKPIEEVTKAMINRALDEIEAGGANGRSRTTSGKVRALLLTAFDRAVDSDAIAKNVVAKTDARKSKKAKPVWLDVDQATAMLEELDDHPWRAIYIVLAMCGLRRSEALGMRWEHVDLGRGTLKVRWTLVKLISGELVLDEITKTEASRRTIKLPQAVVDALVAHRAVYGELSPFVWTQTAARLRRIGQTATTPHGLPHPDSLRGPLERACKAAGVPHVTPHQLRHSAGSIALAAGATTRAIMDMLGHSDHRTAVGYQHVADAVREGTAAQLDAAWGTAAKESADSDNPPTDGDDDS